MDKKLAVGLLVGIVLGAFLSLWFTSAPLADLLTQPLRVLWRSPRQLQNGVLEIADYIDPVQTATRRLLKPFGAVRLTRQPAMAGPSESSSEKSQAPR